MKKIIISMMLCFGLVFAFAACGDTSGSGDSGDVAQEEATEEAIEYTSYDVGELMEDLEKNAAAAKDKYDGQYVKLTGRLGNIDASGDYIDIYDADDEFAFTGVQCYTQNDKQKDKIKELSTDDIVVVKGKITDVGEILGYSLDIDKIKKKD